VIKESTEVSRLWRLIAVTLITVSIALAGYFGKRQDDRITALETQRVTEARLLGEISAKIDILLANHGILVAVPNK
jgi:hypothetical protein